MASTQAMSKTDSYQYPAAHLGHLTDGQQAAFENFKELCEESGYYHPAGDGRRHASHDDETLLRYLRARKFNPKEGFRQFKETEDWRKENRIVEYYDKIDIEEYDTARKLYPQWTGRRDRRGIPVYVFEVAPLNSKAITSYQASLKNDKSPALNLESAIPPRMLRLFALYENLTRFVLPLCSAVKDRPHPETPISQSNNIVDISGVGLRQFWNLKNHMQDASTVATALYPETLDRIFIIGAPSFFPTVWSWIKRWFDPITVSKIFILSQQDMKETLEKYIAPENIPRNYGGTLDFEYGMLPILEPAIRDVFVSQPKTSALLDAVTEALEDSEEDAAGIEGNAGVKNLKDQSFPIGPVKWRERENGELEAVAVGSDNGSHREVTIGKIKADFGFIHGISRQNTQIDWSKENVLSTTGTATQPTVDGDPEYGKELLDEDSGVQTPADNGAKESNSRTLPILAGKPNATPEGIHESEDQSRTGASVPANLAQGAAHVEGSVAANVLDIVDVGHGDRTAVLTPSTAEQAGKEQPPDMEPNPSKVEQGEGAEALGAATEKS